MDNFNVGDLVQQEQKDSPLKEGVIETVIPPKKKPESDYWNYSKAEQKKMRTHYTVRWNDNSVENNVDSYDLFARDSKMERAFRLASDSVQQKIADKLNEAQKLLDEAIKISEKSGVPFSAGISPLGQSYFPTSFSKKFSELDFEFVNALTGAHTEYYGEGAGWEHSDVC